VEVPGAKNSVLKLMAAALLAEGRTTLTHVPDILDVGIMAELLRRLGADVVFDAASGVLDIDSPATLKHQADYDLVRRMRASIAVLGPLVARAGMADVAVPGGDAIGSRGLDMHIAGLERMGARFTNQHGFLVASAEPAAYRPGSGQATRQPSDPQPAGPAIRANRGRAVPPGPERPRA